MFVLKASVMKATFSIFLTCVVAVMALKVLAAQEHHWTETESETVWHDRYSNCDYGYFVRLPKDTVAHGSLPPSPNHGFVVNVADPSSRAAFDSVRWNRSLWVDASYNVEDISLSSREVDEPSKQQGGSGDSRTLRRRRVKVEGVPAVRVTAEHQTPNGKFLTESITVVRGGIVYRVELQTPQGNYESDLLTFNRLVKGWHFLPLPKGECHNE